MLAVLRAHRSHMPLQQNYRKVNLWGAWENAVFARGAPCDFEAVALELRGGRKLMVGEPIVAHTDSRSCLSLNILVTRFYFPSCLLTHIHDVSFFSGWCSHML